MLEYRKLHTTYLGRLFDLEEFQLSVRKAEATLENVDFDAIAVTGNSGTIFGGALSFAMNKNLILVRKAEDNCHSSLSVEGAFNCTKYIFVDDIMMSGDTFNRVYRIIKRDYPVPCELVGIYEYSLGIWRTNCSDFLNEMAEEAIAYALYPFIAY